MEKKGSLAVVFLVVVIDLLGFGLILPLLPRYAQALDADKFTIGILTGVFSLMQFLVSPLWGQLSDRIGRRPVLLLGLVGSTFFYALFAYGTYVGSLPLLFISRIGAGIAGATIGTAQAYIADVTPPEKRTGGMALIGAAFGIGFTFGPLLGALALVNQPSDSPTVSHWPGVWAAGLSFAALLLAVFRLPESRKPGGPARARKLSAENFRHVLATPLIPALILAFFAATLAFAQFESTLSLVLKDPFEVPDRQTYLIFGYVGFTLILAQGFLVRKLAKKIADEQLARAGVVLMLVGIGLGLVALAAASLWALLAIMPILIGGFALMTPSLQSMVSKRTPADRQGAVLGVNQSASSLARIIGQTVGIWFLKASVFLPYLVTALLMAAVFLLLQFRVLAAVAAETPASPSSEETPAPTQPLSA